MDSRIVRADARQERVKQLLARSLTVPEIARAAGCSVDSASRLLVRRVDS